MWFLKPKVSGKTKIQTIAKIAGADRSNTYQVLDYLQKRGLVEKTVGIPNLYEAVTVKEAVHLLLRRRKHEYDEVVEASKNLLQENKEDEEKLPYDNDTQISLITFEESVPNKKVTSAWVTVQRSAELCVDKHAFEDTISKEGLWITHSWKKAMDRGVKIRIIAEKPQEKDSYDSKSLIDLQKKSNFELKYAPSSIVCQFVCLDEKDIWFFAEKSKTFESLRLIHDGIGKLVHMFFEKLWNEVPTTARTPAPNLGPNL